MSLLLARFAVSSRESSSDRVDLIFVVGVDKTGDVGNLIYRMIRGFVDYFSIPVKVLIGFFDSFGAAEVFHLVVDRTAHVGGEFP